MIDSTLSATSAIEEKMMECGKSEQYLASYYYGLVVKLVVKRDWLTTKD